MNRLMVSIFFMITCCSCSAGWETHPLWVGYDNAIPPRTEGLQGVITKEYIASFLPKKPIIVEVGAHNGTDTCEMASLWPTSTIYAFEPLPNLYNEILKRIQQFKNVFVYPYALSDSNGSALFYISEGASDGSSSLLPPGDHLELHPEVLFEKTITVPTLTLDRWAEKNNITSVDALWLDMQGYEPAMLQASPSVLKTVKIIYTEVNICEVYKGAILYTDYKRWLEEQGFVVVREDLPWIDGGNVLFVRKDYLEQLHK